MITSLTQEQEAQIEIWKKRWFDIGISTDPADKPRTEKAITWAYKKLGLKKPKFVWVDSPADAAVTIKALENIAKMSTAENKKQRARWSEYKKEVLSSMESLSIPTSFWGAQDAYWIAYYKFCNEVVGVEYKEEDKEILNFWSEIAQSCGWWWPYEGACVISDRPRAIRYEMRGENQVLHHTTLPVVEFRDGYSVYAWNGTIIPPEWIEEKDKVDPQLVLTWENIEQRRCLAEILGWDKVLSRLETRTIDKNSDPMIGELLEVDLPDSPKTRFLKVQCGTGRTFAIPVEPTFKTALEAQAAMYRLPINFIAQYDIRT